METRFTKKLDKNNSVSSINADFLTKVFLENSNKLLPDTEMNYIINQGELYNKERQTATKYRLFGTISTLFHNTLHNPSGTDSLATFESLDFRDRQELAGNLMLYSESLDYYIKDQNGWYGYEPKVLTAQSNTIDWVELNPKKKEFEIINQSQSNWELSITYPYSSDTTHFLVDGGLKIIDVQIKMLGNRPLLVFYTPVKHGLVEGDQVKIFNFGTIGAFTGTVRTVVLNGLPNGSMQDYAFIIDKSTLSNIPFVMPSFVATRMKKYYSGNDSQYYLRLFKRITEPNDYEIFPLTFSNTIYNDSHYQFVFNGGSGTTIDIDVSPYRDNRNRPLTELYLTNVKTDPNNIFTDVKSGFEMPFNDMVQADLQGNADYIGLSDIHRIHDGGSYPILSHTPLETNVLSGDTIFYGDVVEYNSAMFIETKLGDVYHRFNTDNRLVNDQLAATNSYNSVTISMTEVWEGQEDIGATTLDFISSATATQIISLGRREEGYYYKAHHRIQLRNWSNYVEYGNTGTTQQLVGNEIVEVPRTYNIPDYAEFIDGRFVWRDIMSIGNQYLISGDFADYPFLNGAHYIYQNYLLALRRQDPYGKYGLYYAEFPKDPYGDKFFDDNYVYNLITNVC